MFKQRKIVETIIPDDESIYEAQLLLDDWMKEKKFDYLQNEVNFQNEGWFKTTQDIGNVNEDIAINNNQDVENTLRNKWFTKSYDENAQDGIFTSDYMSNSIQANSDFQYKEGHASHTDMLMQYGRHNDDIDTNLLVNEVLSGMMNKDVVKKVDLGLKKKKQTDPKLRMEMRHAKIREQKEARLSKQGKLHNVTKKDIKKLALDQITLEDDINKQKEILEEKAVQNEMKRIRKERFKEKELINELQSREEDLMIKVKQEMQEEIHRQRQQRKIEQEKRKHSEKIMQRKFEEEVKEKALKEYHENIKVLQQHFSSWHELIQQKRVNEGKARILSDFKLKMRTWNAWRTYFLHFKLDEYAMEYEQNMKQKYRQEKMAVSFFESRLKRKCINSWLVYTRYQLDKKLIKLEHENKAKKMALFLEAVSKGAIWNENKNTVDKKSNLHSQNEAETEDDSISQTADHLQKKVSNKLDNNPMGQTKSNLRENIKIKQNKSRLTRTLQRLSSKISKEELNTDLESSQSEASSYDHISTVSATSTHLYEKSNIQATTDGTTVPSSVCSDKSRTASSRSSTVSSNRPTTKPLYLAMEEREQARRKRKAELDEQKRLKDEMKLKELREKEMERIKKEQQEKEELLMKKREERRIQREEERKKQLRKEMFLQNLSIADSHYERVLVQKYGLLALKSLVHIKKTNEEKAEIYYHKRLYKNVFKNWLKFTEEEIEKKEVMAKHCHDKLLCRRYFMSWQKIRFHHQNLQRLAKWYRKKQVKKLYFNAWKEYTLDEKILFWAKKSKADESNDKRLLKKTLLALKRFVEDEKNDRIREKRCEEMRKKVKAWLLDFNDQKLKDSPV